MRYMLKTIRRKRAVVDLPLPAAKLQARLLEIADTLTFGLLPDTLKLTRDQVILLQNDNVVSEAAKAEGRTFEGIGIIPTAAEAVVPGYLWTFRKAGQFSTDRDEEHLSEVPDMLAAKPMAAGSQHRPKTASGPGDRRGCRELAGRHGCALGHPEAGIGDRSPQSCAMRAREPRPGAASVRRILVTGAAGFVGGHVLPRLAAAGDRVAGIGRGARPGLPAGVAYETHRPPRRGRAERLRGAVPADRDPSPRGPGLGGGFRQRAGADLAGERQRPDEPRRRRRGRAGLHVLLRELRRGLRQRLPGRPCPHRGRPSPCRATPMPGRNGSASSCCATCCPGSA